MIIFSLCAGKTEILSLNLSNKIAFKAKLNHVLMGSLFGRQINILYGSFSTWYYFSDTLRSVLDWHKKIFPRLCLNCRERVTWVVKAAVPVQEKITTCSSKPAWLWKSLKAQVSNIAYGQRKFIKLKLRAK